MALAVKVFLVFFAAAFWVGLVSLVILATWDRCYFCGRIVRYRVKRAPTYGPDNLYCPRCYRSFYDGRDVREKEDRDA